MGIRLHCLVLSINTGSFIIYLPLLALSKALFHYIVYRFFFSPLELGNMVNVCLFDELSDGMGNGKSGQHGVDTTGGRES